MRVQHLPRTASIEESADAIADHGYAIVDDLVPIEMMDQIEAELKPYLDATPYGEIEELGLLTRRTGSLIARSPTVRTLVMNDLVLGAVSQVLSRASTKQLTFTEVISLDPGAKAQFLHRDELLFDGYPFTNDYEVYCNTIWALSDYTEEMGATRIVPGSHRFEQGVVPTPADTIAAEMSRGSVLIYSGKLWHGGGENRSDRIRRALVLGFAVGWVRQEENQYLSCPAAIARTLPEELLRVMGYDASHGYGIVTDRNDPLTVLMRGDEATAPSREETPPNRHTK